LIHGDILPACFKRQTWQPLLTCFRQIFVPFVADWLLGKTPQSQSFCKFCPKDKMRQMGQKDGGMRLIEVAI